MNREKSPIESNISTAEESRSAKTAAYNRSTYGERIRRFRTMRGLTQPKLAAILGVHRNYISNWESGIARPDLNRIPDICAALDISANQFFGMPDRAEAPDDDLRHIFRQYQSMDERSRAILTETCDSLIRVQERELFDRCRRDFVKVFHGCQFAAAGTLNPLDDDRDGEYEYIRFSGREVPDEIITVSGDSMEPTFHAGDDLLVRRTEVLREGEIGIILINGEGYVKEYHADGVRSHNEARYPFRRFTEGDDVRCYGRVIGKVSDSMRPDARESEALHELFEGGRAV